MLKIFSLTDPSQSQNPGQLERPYNSRRELRKDARHPGGERLFFQIASSQAAELVGTTVHSRVLNVSANGLNIESRAFALEADRLDMWIDNYCRPGKFFLTGDVKWSSNSRDGICCLGIALHDSPTTDLAEWRLAYPG